MRKLATYSIETDHTVRLDFVDGQRMRVPVAKLSMYLHAPDLQRVERAVKIRRQFILRHMPKVIVGVAMAGLVTALFVAPRSVNRLLAPTQAPAPESQQSAAARAVALTPTPTPTSHAGVGSVQSASTQNTYNAGPKQGNQNYNTAEVTGKTPVLGTGATDEPSQAKSTVAPKPKTLKASLPLHLNLSLPL